MHSQVFEPSADRWRRPITVLSRNRLTCAISTRSLTRARNRSLVGFARGTSIVSRWVLKAHSATWRHSTSRRSLVSNSTDSLALKEHWRGTRRVTVIHGPSSVPYWPKTFNTYSVRSHSKENRRRDVQQTHPSAGQIGNCSQVHRKNIFPFFIFLFSTNNN
jgi:hypothetical protein